MHYDIGVIPCTSGKRPEGLTPLTLYKGGPFSLMMRHAQQRCRVILIMSAKYGLLELTDPVSWYEAYLPELSASERGKLLSLLRAQALKKLVGRKVLWYPSRGYWEAMAEACPEVIPSVIRPYRKLPSLRLFKVLSNEIKNYGQFPARR